MLRGSSPWYDDNGSYLSLAEGVDMQLMIRKARKFWIAVQMCFTQKHKEQMQLKMKHAISDLQNPWIDFEELQKVEDAREKTEKAFLNSLGKK